MFLCQEERAAARAPCLLYSLHKRRAPAESKPTHARHLQRGLVRELSPGCPRGRRNASKFPPTHTNTAAEGADIFFSNKQQRGPDTSAAKLTSRALRCSISAGSSFSIHSEQQENILESPSRSQKPVPASSSSTRVHKYQKQIGCGGEGAGGGALQMFTEPLFLRIRLWGRMHFCLRF